MLDSIRSSFRESINDAEWLDGSTRIGAVEKLAKIVAIVGYDPKFLSSGSHQSRYLSYTVKDNDYFGNRLEYKILSSNDLFRNVNAPVDREHNDIAPHVMTASYNVRQNQVMLPALHLQPPLFHPDYPDYVNVGGMGVIMAHELSVP